VKHKSVTKIMFGMVSNFAYRKYLPIVLRFLMPTHSEMFRNDADAPML
jgi:hypothetical protein